MLAQGLIIGEWISQLRDLNFLAGKQSSIYIFDQRKIPIIDVAYTFGETHQENPFNCLFICSLVHSFIQQLLSTHYVPGIIEIKWEIRQTVVSVLMMLTSLWKDQTLKSNKSGEHQRAFCRGQ